MVLSDEGIVLNDGSLECQTALGNVELYNVLTLSFMIFSASRRTFAVAGERETSSGAGS